MKLYIRLIQYPLGGCFFYGLLGGTLLCCLGYANALSGWLWGIGAMVVYILFLAWHTVRLRAKTAETMVWQARRQMFQRFLILISFLTIAKVLTAFDMRAVVLAIVGMQIVLYPVVVAK